MHVTHNSRLPRRNSRRQDLQGFVAISVTSETSTQTLTAEPSATPWLLVCCTILFLILLFIHIVMFRLVINSTLHTQTQHRSATQVVHSLSLRALVSPGARA